MLLNRAYRHYSIQTRLLIFTIAILLPFTLYTGLQTYFFSEQHILDVQKKNHILAKLLAKNLSNKIHDSFILAQTIAQRPELTNPGTPECNKLMADFRELHLNFIGTGYIDKNGIHRCTSRAGDKPPSPVSFVDNEWFQRAKAEKKPLISRPYIGKVLKTWLVIVVVPVFDVEGNFNGTINLPLDLNSIQPVSQGLLIEQANVTVVDNWGTVIFHSMNQEQWTGKNIKHTKAVDIALKRDSGLARTFSKIGSDTLIAFTMVPETNWHLIVSVSADKIYAPVKKHILITSLIWLILTLFTLVVAYKLARHIAKPIHQLAMTTRQLASGQSELRAIAEGPSEIIELALDFNKMLEQRKLHEAELQVSAIAFESQEGIFITDANGKILKVNQAFTKITGYSEKEAYGQSPRLLNSGRHPPEFFSDIYKQLGEKGRWYGEIWNRRKNGEIYPEWLTITEVKNTQKQVTHYVAALTDITERKEAESKINKTTMELKEKQQIYQDIFENSQSANIIYKTIDNGETFIIVSVNKALENIEGMKREELINKTVNEAFKGAEKTGIFGHFKNVYRTGQSYYLPTCLFEYNNKKVWRENYIFKLPSGEIIASYEDRTKEKELEIEKLDNYEKTVDSLVALIEHRDNYTGGHSQRVAVYSRMVAEEMNYSPEDCEIIYRAGILHDIGKVTTPDAILLKPDKLNNDEYELIQSHAQTGADMLKKIPMYHELYDIVLSHHERIDGSGYPQGLLKDEIPPLAKIMSVCDAFDAMTTNRIYKGRKSVKEALTELQSLAGVHYEENVVMAAHKVLSTLKLNDDTSQFPETKLEQQRFAFFFKDQVTEAFNENYLRIVLQRNQFDFQYVCLCVVFLKNFSQYNERFGWKQGDKVLNQVSQMIQKEVSGSLVFRLHGDDFIIMNKEHYQVDLKKFEQSSNLPEKNISLQHIHFHIQKDEIGSVDDLENKIQQFLSSLEN